MDLNYSKLQGIARKEKSSPSLQEIPKDFYSSMPELIGKLELDYKKAALKLADDIYYARAAKIVRLASRQGEKSPPKNMAEEEKKIYDEAVILISRQREEMLGRELEEKAMEAPEEKKAPSDPDDGRLRVRILKPLPAITGSDLAHYGPFEENDVVRLPPGTIRVLLKKGVVEEA